LLGVFLLILISNILETIYIHFWNSANAHLPNKIHGAERPNNPHAIGSGHASRPNRRKPTHNVALAERDVHKLLRVVFH
jgi:hypothetical protein